MAQTVEQAKHNVEVSRATLVADLDKFESKVKAQLDWKARVRRDAPQYIAIVGGVIVIAGVAAISRRWRSGKHEPKTDVDLTIDSDDDVAVQLAKIQLQLEQLRSGTFRSGSPLLQKIAMRGVTSAASAAGLYAARRIFENLGREQTTTETK